MRDTNQPAVKDKQTDTTMNVDKFIAEIMSDLRSNRIELPTLPQVAVKISSIVENQQSSAKDVAKVITKDPALSARLIQVANSPIVRGDKKIDNVQAAVTRMGITIVKNIVTSFLVQQLFRTKHKALHSRMTEIWNHSAHVAAISHVLATHFSDLKPDEVMLAGLLHDIGKLPILAKARKITNVEQYENLLDKVLEKLHPALGKAILESWKFAPELVAAASEHEKVNRESASLDITDIIIVANLHSHMGKNRGQAIDWNSIPALTKLNLDPQASIAVLQEAQIEITEIQKLFTS